MNFYFGKNTNSYSVLVRRSLALFFALGLVVVSFSCDSRADTGDPEQERNLLLLVLYQKTDANWLASCMTAQDTALSCASSASATALYTGALETAWGLSIPSPKGSSEICSTVDSSASFNKMSAGARSCYFRCQESYWQDQTNQGKCTPSAYGTALQESVTVPTSCFSKCLSEKTIFAY